MKAVHLREKSDADLRELQKTLAQDVFQNRIKNFTNRLDDTSAAKKAKRDLARVATVLRERVDPSGKSASTATKGTAVGSGAVHKGEASRS
jgi:large subunit ribosomal protein L29